MNQFTVIGCLSLGLAGAAAAQEPIAPETLTVETQIPAGPNVLSLDQAWAGRRGSTSSGPATCR